MKAYSLIIISVCLYLYTTADLGPELEKLYCILDMELILNMKESYPIQILCSDKIYFAHHG